MGFLVAIIINKCSFTGDISRQNMLRLILLLLASSLLLTFNYPAWSRVLFYIASYLALLVVIINFRKLPSAQESILALLLMFIGLSKLIWFFIIYTDSPYFDADNSYLITGKRLLLAGVIAWAVFTLRRCIEYRDKKVLQWAIMLTFLLASLTGLYQMINSQLPRIDFYLGHATDAAYLYAAISLCTIAIISYAHWRYGWLLLIISIVLSYFLILKTGTRNVLISYPLILLLISILWNRQWWKNILLATGVIMLVLCLGYKSFVQPKIDNTLREIQLYHHYQGDKLASLSSRLAMWSVGYQLIKQHPWGMGREARKQWFIDYTTKTQRNNSALHYVDVHLHNELLDSASLQGVMGALIIIVSYLYWLWISVRQKNGTLLALILVIIGAGLTDVVFISREQTVFFSSLLILLTVAGPVANERDSVNKQRMSSIDSR